MKSCEVPNLEIEVERADEVDVLVGETLVLPHEVGEREVPVGRLPLRQEDGVVEAQVLAASHLLVLLENVVEPVCDVQLRLRDKPRSDLMGGLPGRSPAPHIPRRQGCLNSYV